MFCAMLSFHASVLFDKQYYFDLLLFRSHQRLTSYNYLIVIPFKILLWWLTESTDIKSTLSTYIIYSILI